MIFRRQCWGRTGKGERCGNTPQKDSPFCRLHQNQTITTWNKASSFLKKHWKGITGITGVLFALFTAFVTLVGIIPSTFDFLNPKFSFSLDQRNNDPNYVSLLLKNESKNLNIKDVGILAEVIYSIHEGPVIVSNSEVVTKSISGIKNSEIEKIEPGRTATTQYNVIYFVGPQRVQKGAVCFHIKYKGDIGFMDLRKEETFGMYYDTEIKTPDWLEMPCENIRATYRLPTAIKSRPEP